jgi:predicted dehydrogenase
MRLANLPGSLKVIEAEAALTESGVDDSLRASLRSEYGVDIRLSASMASNVKASAALRIIGEVGEIEFINPIAPQLGARLRCSTETVVDAAPIEGGTTFFYQLKRILAALSSGGPLPCEGEAILRQQRALDEIYAAAGLERLRRGFV